MKKTLTSILFLICSLFLFSQESKYSIGIHGLAGNYYYKSASNHKLNPQLSYGAGMQLNYSTEKFQFSVGVTIQSNKVKEQFYNNNLLSKESQLSFTYLYVPIIAKYKIIDREKFGCYIPFGFVFGNIIDKSITTTYPDGRQNNDFGLFEINKPISVNIGVLGFYKLTDRIFLELGFDFNTKIRSESINNPHLFFHIWDRGNYSLKTGICINL